ncbi:type VI secretion system protein VasI [Yoonia maricola]|uniref:Type VI secretion system protein VasI n=1 Tax=Yoonia maricola TaxID=420999 RepID=A0A2M8WP08_9RHOB|nr:type VI secretion system-associated protein TagO [Yoonia maricola]PJI92667.1 type VI secretion system protein VasI [Yoonia maricola]
MKTMLMLSACIAGFGLAAVPAAASDELPNCSPETVGVRCIERTEEIGPWQIQELVPPVGSQNSLSMSSQSFQPLPGMFGSEEPAELVLSCIENTTQFEVRFGQNFMSDVGDFGTLIYKLDDQPPVLLQAVVSEDNDALGLFTGAQAIPVIIGLFGAERLLVSATSFTGRTLDASFSIQDIEPAASSLRELCRW